MEQLSDSDIRTGLKLRNEQVYEYLFRKYYVGLCAYAIRYLERKDLAEEVVSETYFRMWQKGVELNLNGSIKSYLFQAVYNNCMHALRQQKAESIKQHIIQQEFENKKDQQLLSNYSEQDSLILKELSSLIQEAVEKLPEQSQRVFILKRHEGKKNKEVADQLNISVKTVEMHMTRALLFLRNELKDYLPSFLLIYFLEF